LLIFNLSAATPAPPKPAAAPSGKKKLTDREKADRMLNGGVKHYGGDHNTEMAHASKEEAARLSVEENKRIKEAQKEVLVLLNMCPPATTCLPTYSHH
jgi:hypothetical protein